MQMLCSIQTRECFCWAVFLDLAYSKFPSSGRASPKTGPWLLRTETPENTDIKLATVIEDLETTQDRDSVPLEIADEKQYFESQMVGDAKGTSKAAPLDPVKTSESIRRVENWDPKLNSVS